MVNKEDIVKLLNDENIKFELVEHEAVYTMEDIEKLNIKDKGTEVKNLFLRDEKGKNHFLIVAKASDNFEISAGSLSKSPAKILSEKAKININNKIIENLSKYDFFNFLIFNKLIKYLLEKMLNKN